MKLLLTMGYHTGRKNERFRYDMAGVVLIDWDKKRVLRELTYVSPPEQAALEGHMLFAYGQLNGKQLVVTTHTEVVFIDLNHWKIARVVSLPHFNDLHHAVVYKDRLFVCNTGLQAVQELTLEGKLIETLSTDGRATWDEYKKDVDYRPLSTKPHRVHPNFLFELDGELWVTRCKKKDAVQLHNHQRRLDVEVGMPHDGIPRHDHVYFTTTTGHIVGVDPATGRCARHIDLNVIDTRRRQLGWCRGLRFIDDNLAIVGFGQFRRTSYKELAHWILNDGKATLPSRLALYDLRLPRLLDEMVFSAQLEGAAIFSIFPWEE